MAILATGFAKEVLCAKFQSLILDGNSLHQSGPIVDILKKTRALVELNLADNTLG